jgi:MinD-like ATPase involved in chromosome partitioning or flagellar assembly
MTTLRVTVVGPDGSQDLELLGDLALAELIPALLNTSLVASDVVTPAEWILAPLSGEPLSPARTLLELGVADGQILQLRRTTGRFETPRGPMPRPAPIEPGSPLTRAREVLPAVATIRDRLGGSRQYIGRLDAAIRATPLKRCATIAVVSPKGGVGKSTVSVLLGALFSELRDERVIAVDADSDYGSLGPWLAPDHPFSVSDLIEAVDGLVMTETELDRQLAAGPDQLRVCPAPADLELMAGLDAARYSQALGLLQRRAAILILDCGTGLAQPGVQGAIDASTQLIVVTDAEPATVDQVWPAAAVLRHLDKPIVVVVSRTKLSGGEADRIDAAFPYASALLSISSEPAAARTIASGSFSFSTAPRSWQRDVRELAAVLVAAWSSLGLGAPRVIA